MPDYMSVRQASRLWNLTERRVSALCATGRIEGAVKAGRSWKLPADSQVPADKRVTTGAYRKEGRDAVRPLPVGVSSYKQAMRQYHVVDKTLLIRDLLNERPLVTVFNRPCKFGKTLILDMLKTFLEAGEKDPAVYFRGTKIWSCGSSYREHMGRYPVLSLSFRVWGCNTWAMTYEAIKKEIQYEARRLKEKIDPANCEESDLEAYQVICSGSGTEADYIASGRILCKLLSCSCREKTVILLDDYDVPMQKGDGKKAEAFLKAFLGSAFQDNSDLAFACVAGNLPRYGMSLFCGVENTVVSRAENQKYSEYFGFSDSEVAELAAYYGRTDCTELCRSWYGGYRQGTEERYNPWSVASFFQNGCVPRTYWMNPTSDSQWLELPAASKCRLYVPLKALLTGKTVPAFLDPYSIGEEKEQTATEVLCKLLLCGYATVQDIEETAQGTCLGKLCLPNRETALLLRTMVIKMLESILPKEQVLIIQEALYTKERAAIQGAIRSILTSAAAGSDDTVEAFYDSLSLMFCALLGEAYTVESTQAANGRCTMLLIPQSPENPGIILEMKAERSCTATELKRGAVQLYRLIGERKLEDELKKRGAETVLPFGVGICGKNAEVATL